MAACALISPNVLVDRLVAYPQRSIAVESAADLIWAEALAQQPLHEHPLLARELAPSACP